VLKVRQNIQRYLLEQFPLSSEELEMFKRGRNHKSDTIPKNADVQTYRLATGLEAVWGYLYLTDNQQRLAQLWDIYKTFAEENYGTIYIR
jgi:ribonuclease III family protein